MRVRPPELIVRRLRGRSRTSGHPPLLDNIVAADLQRRRMVLGSMLGPVEI
jgi:hypothetical protein